MKENKTNSIVEEAKKLREAYTLRDKAYTFSPSNKGLSARSEYLATFGMAIQAGADYLWIVNNLRE